MCHHFSFSFSPSQFWVAIPGHTTPPAWPLSLWLGIKWHLFTQKPSRTFPSSRHLPACPMSPPRVKSQLSVGHSVSSTTPRHCVTARTTAKIISGNIQIPASPGQWMLYPESLQKCTKRGGKFHHIEETRPVENNYFLASSNDALQHIFKTYSTF